MTARLAAAALMLIAASAFAQLGISRARAERWIELRLKEDPIRIGYRIGFGAELAREQRTAADRDGDGEVSVAEGNAALDAKTAELLAQLRICTGRSLAELECGPLRPSDVELVEADGWSPGPTGDLRIGWTLRLRSGARKLAAIRVEDGWEVPAVEITDVRIEPPPGLALTRAGDGNSPDAVRTEFTWNEARRAPGPRIIAASWPERSRSAWPLLAIAAALIASGALLWARAQRKARTPAGSS